MGKTHKRQIITLGTVFFSLLIIFQNCSEVKPLNSVGEFEVDPSSSGDQNNGNNSGDSGNGDGNSGDNGDGGGNGFVGTYDNSDPYKCDYNDDGIVDFETRSNGIQNNSRPLGYEFIQPQGFTMYNKTWSSQFNGRAFGEPISYLAPIGSFSVGDASAAGMYITIPFVAEENAHYHLEWYEAQAVQFAEYWNPRSARSVLVSVSPCAGDLRSWDRTSTDVWVKACRKESSQSILPFGTATGFSCKLKARKTYWLTITFTGKDENGLFSPNLNTCAGGRAECEANFDLN